MPNPFKHTPRWLRIAGALTAVLALAAVASGWNWWNDAERSLRVEAIARLDASAEQGTMAVASWNAKAEEAAARLASDPMTVAAIAELGPLAMLVRTDNFIRGSAAEALRTAIPQDARAKVDTDGVLIQYFHRAAAAERPTMGHDRSRYGAAMTWWDPRLRSKAEENNILELALAGPDGRVVYSSRRSGLLGARLSGPLAEAAENARNKGTIMVPPGVEGPHALSVSATANGGTILAWSALDNLADEVAAMGSDVTLLRPDGLAALQRAMPPSRHSNDPVFVGLDGHTAWGRDPEGRHVAVRPVNLMGQRWAVVARDDLQPTTVAIGRRAVENTTDNLGGTQVATMAALGLFAVGGMAWRRRRVAEVLEAAEAPVSTIVEPMVTTATTARSRQPRTPRTRRT